MDNHKILKYSYWLSIICLIHCITFPILTAILPFINIVFEINEWIEIGIIGSVIIFGSYSLIHAYITHHKNINPLVVFYIGIIISVYIHFPENHSHNHNNFSFNYKIFLEIFSGILIAFAQLYNLKITPRTCNHNHSNDEVEKIDGIINKL